VKRARTNIDAIDPAWTQNFYRQRFYPQAQFKRFFFLFASLSSRSNTNKSRPQNGKAEFEAPALRGLSRGTVMRNPRYVSTAARQLSHERE
jgi:hypothetical protein